MTDTSTRRPAVTSTPPRDDVKRHRLTACWDGLIEARSNLDKALTACDEAQTRKRQAEIAVDAAKNEADDALQLELYRLGALFVVHANKNYLVEDDAHTRSFTAAEKTEWLQREAAKDDDVRATASALRSATAKLDEARDRITSAERHLQGCRYHLEAAGKQVDVLTVAYGKAL